jgi:hypothetical protein
MQRNRRTLQVLARRIERAMRPIKSGFSAEPTENELHGFCTVCHRFHPPICGFMQFSVEQLHGSSHSIGFSFIGSWAARLPMECSTTELRQRAPDTGLGQKGRYKAADPCHKAPARASAGPACGVVKGGRNQEEAAAASFSRASCGPIRFPISSPSAASALMGRIMTSNSTISPDSLNLMRSMPLSCHLPILEANSSATS